MGLKDFYGEVFARLAALSGSRMAAARDEALGSEMARVETTEDLSRGVLHTGRFPDWGTNTDDLPRAAQGGDGDTRSAIGAGEPTPLHAAAPEASGGNETANGIALGLHAAAGSKAGDPASDLAQVDSVDGHLIPKAGLAFDAGTGPAFEPAAANGPADLTATGIPGAAVPDSAGIRQTDDTIGATTPAAAVPDDGAGVGPVAPGDPGAAPPIPDADAQQGPVRDGPPEPHEGEAPEPEAEPTTTPDATDPDATTTTPEAVDANEAPDGISLGPAGPHFGTTATLTVRLGGEAYRGDPKFEIRVDGEAVAAGSVTWARETTTEGRYETLGGNGDVDNDSVVWRDIMVEVPVPVGGFETVEVRYPNDAYRPGIGDRNLLVDYIEIDGHRIEAEGRQVTYEGAGAAYETTRGAERMPWRGSLKFDAAPVFEDATFGPQAPDAPTVSENDAGAMLGRITVSDPDVNDVHDLAVSDDRFEIVESRLKLKDGVALDHETEARIDLDITATDRGGESVTERVTVDVADLNEAPRDIGASAVALPEDDLVLWLDGRDRDGDFTEDATDRPAGATWVDKSGAGSTGRLHGAPPEATGAGLDFADTANGYAISGNAELNRGTFPEKSFAVSFRTGDDVSGVQMIYEQGGTVRGYSLSIAPHPDTGDPTLWGLAYNRSEWDPDHQIKALELGPAEPERVYNVALVHDATAPDAADRTFTGYLDGKAVASAGHVDIQYNHPDAAGIGNLVNGTVLPHTGQPFRGDIPFKGTISEAMSWNGALNEGELASLDSHFLANRQGEGTPTADDAAISEAATAGSVIATLSAQDPDAGDTPSFRIVDEAGAPAEDPRFEIDGSAIRLKPGAALDFETAESHALRIEVQDAGGLTHTETVVLKVLDVDEAPTGVTLQGGRVTDDAAGGDVIGTLSAVDPEGGQAVSFGIVGGADRVIEHPLFEIDGDSLRLRAGARLESDAQDSHTLRVQAIDGAGNVGYDTITVRVDDAPEPLDTQVLTGFRAEYFARDTRVRDLDEIDFSARPDHAEIVSRIDYDAGHGSFWQGGDTDTFAARIAGRIEVAEAGTFTFHLGGDDGAELFVDGKRLIDNDADHGFRTRSGEIELTPGDHAIEVRYFENFGRARLKLDWEGPGIDEREPVPAGQSLALPRNGTLPLSISVGGDDIAASREGGFTAQYFDMQGSLRTLSDIDWEAAPTHSETLRTIDYENSAGSFWEGGDTNTFGARISGMVEVDEAGRYDFHLSADDGALLYVNGEPVIDFDGLHAFDTRSGSIDLEPGAHAIEVRYFENHGHAGLKLEWEGPGTDGRAMVTAVENTPASDAGSETTELVGLPRDTLLIAGDTAVRADGGPVDVTGIDLAALDLAPPPGFSGSIEMQVRKTSAHGEGEHQVALSPPVEIVVGDPEVADGDVAADPFLHELVLAPEETAPGWADDAAGPTFGTDDAAAAEDDVLSEVVAAPGDAEFAMDIAETYERQDW